MSLLSFPAAESAQTVHQVHRRDDVVTGQFLGGDDAFSACNPVLNVGVGPVGTDQDGVDGVGRSCPGEQPSHLHRYLFGELHCAAEKFDGIHRYLGRSNRVEQNYRHRYTPTVCSNRTDRDGFPSKDRMRSAMNCTNSTSRTRAAPTPPPSTRGSGNCTTPVVARYVALG